MKGEVEKWGRVSTVKSAMGSILLTNNQRHVSLLVKAEGKIVLYGGDENIRRHCGNEG